VLIKFKADYGEYVQSLKTNNDEHDVNRGQEGDDCEVGKLGWCWLLREWGKLT